jgi:hypothetical protein
MCFQKRVMGWCLERKRKSRLDLDLRTGRWRYGFGYSKERGCIVRYA